MAVRCSYRVPRRRALATDADSQRPSRARAESARDVSTSALAAEYYAVAVGLGEIGKFFLRQHLCQTLQIRHDQI